MGTILIIPNADFSENAIDGGNDYQFGIKAARGQTYKLREYTTPSAYTDNTYTSTSDSQYNWHNRVASTAKTTANFFYPGSANTAITNIIIHDSFWTSPTVINSCAGMFQNMSNLKTLNIGAFNVSNLAASSVTSAIVNMFYKLPQLTRVNASKCTAATRTFLISCLATAPAVFWDNAGILTKDDTWTAVAGTAPSGATVYSHANTYQTGDIVTIQDASTTTNSYYFVKRG